MKHQTPIQTTDNIISVSGKVFYNDRRRRIDVKRPIRNLFEKGSLDVGYVMEVCSNKITAVQRIKELTGKNIVPVLLYFTREEENEMS
jgi:hypothetical protein